MLAHLAGALQGQSTYHFPPKHFFVATHTFKQNYATTSFQSTRLMNPARLRSAFPQLNCVSFTLPTSQLLIFLASRAFHMFCTLHK